MIKNLIVTGRPGSGKSTLLFELVKDVGNKVGFVTKEIREGGERRGFEIEASTGAKALLASVDFSSQFRVSRYGVNVDNLDSALTSIFEFGKGDLLYVDEIGEMELFSEKFKELVLEYFDSCNICVASLTKVYSDDFIETLLKRDDVFVVEINKENRGEKLEFLRLFLRKIEKARGYAKEPERFEIDGASAKMRSTHANRNLELSEGRWVCGCDFYKKYGICSHVLALGEILNRKIVL
jgi:nucleoside-triphosphatase